MQSVNTGLASQKKIRLTILDDLAWYEGDDQNPVVEVLDRELSTTKGGQEVDLDRCDEVGALSLEPLVRLLLDDNNDIAWFRAWSLIALAIEGDRLAVLHALVDMHLQNLLFGHHLLALARLTPVLGVDDFTRPRALVARALHLLDHGTHLAQRNLDTPTVTSMARPDGALLSTLALALAANDVASERELGGLALVEVFEGYMDAMDEILCSARSTWSSSAAAKESSTTTKELAEQILHGRVRWCAE